MISHIKKYIFFYIFFRVQKKKDIKKEIGEKNKRIRKKKKYTQEQLAEMIDISPRNLSNIEHGINFAKANTLEKILVALNVSTEELFSNDELKNSDILIKEIIENVEKLHNDRNSLEKVYKIVKFLTSK